MNDTRARFEEIWPVPYGIFWNCYDGGSYDVIPIRALEDTYRNLAREWDARLDTFTRCQETTFSKEELNLFRQ